MSDRRPRKSEGLRHAVLISNLVRVLGNLVAGTSAAVLSPGIAVGRSAASTLGWPDVPVVGLPPQVADDASWCICNPIVIVEVFTAASEREDRGSKFEGYRTLPSLTDYVLVSEGQVMIDHYLRRPDERWQLFRYFAGGRVQLGAIAGVLAVDDVYWSWTP